MKKQIIFFVMAGILLASCANTEDDSGGNPGNGVEVKTGKVTFFNESSYKVVVHQDYFNGPALLELNTGQSKKVDVRTSDNYGVGSTFSIEYLYRITNAFDSEAGEVIASGIDPNVQINFVIEENKTYTRQIPQPANLEFRNAFLRILNASSLPFELRHLDAVIKQAGNNNLSVAPGRTGVYKLDNIGAEGKLVQNYTINGNFTATAIPGFTAMNGKIYQFTFNGSQVTSTGEQNLIFN